VLPTRRDSQRKNARGEASGSFFFFFFALSTRRRDRFRGIVRLVDPRYNSSLLSSDIRASAIGIYRDLTPARFIPLFIRLVSRARARAIDILCAIAR